MTLPDMIAAIERCKFECEAGPLENFVAWQELRAHTLGVTRIVQPAGLPHDYTPSADLNTCTVCGDGPWGRHRFQRPGSD